MYTLKRVQTIRMEQIFDLKFVENLFFLLENYVCI